MLRVPNHVSIILQAKFAVNSSLRVYSKPLVIPAAIKNRHFIVAVRRWFAVSPADLTAQSRLLPRPSHLLLSHSVSQHPCLSCDPPSFANQVSSKNLFNPRAQSKYIGFTTQSLNNIGLDPDWANLAPFLTAAGVCYLEPQRYWSELTRHLVCRSCRYVQLRAP